MKLGFNSFNAFVSGAKSSWRVALNKGRTSSGSPMAAHGTRSGAKSGEARQQAAEPISTCWQDYERFFPTLESISSISSTPWQTNIAVKYHHFQ